MADLSGGLNVIVLNHSSYLSDRNFVAVKSALAGSKMGLMMLLSTLQYSAPYLGQYSGAAQSMGSAAFTTSGGQQLQDNFLKTEGKTALDTAHNIGLTDTEMGIVGLTYKVYRNRGLNTNLPKIGFVNTSLTIQPGNASLGVDWKF